MNAKTRMTANDHRNLTERVTRRMLNAMLSTPASATLTCRAPDGRTCGRTHRSAANAVTCACWYAEQEIRATGDKKLTAYWPQPNAAQ